MAEAETETEPLPSADSWLGEIDQALKREKNFRDRGKKVVKRYRDERSAGSVKGDSRINILWSNTEVLKASIYPATAKPDVRRRFPDTPETTVMSRTAAEVVERSVAYAIDVEDVDDPIEAALEDNLLPGRGTCWISYEPTLSTNEYGVEDITGQTLCLEHVFWQDFVHSKGRGWKNVWWGARRHAMAPDAFKEKFPKARPSVPNRDYRMDEDGQDDGAGDIEVWEIWDKRTKTRLYVARGYMDVLQIDDDPYQLSGFFPFPKPLFSITTTDNCIPQAEFLQYQDQANELDRVSTRITRLTEQLKWKGIYDASVDAGENKLKDLASSEDGDFLPYQNWQHLREKGGIENAVGFWPMERIIGVLKELHIQKAQLVQSIYEVTGISDIIRGSTDPNETKGAQVLKAQFGSMRMQARQREVQRFIRDCYRIMAEIIAEHFTEETLKGITGMELASAPVPQLPAPVPAGMPEAGPAPMDGNALPQDVAPTPAMQSAPKPTWQDVLGILRSDKLRSYRIDIETDQTAFQDAEAEKAKRIEFMTAVNEMLEKAYLAATQAPMMLPLIRETFMFAIRSFKAGRVMEQAAEDAFEQLMRNPPKPQQKDDGKAADAQGKLAVEMKKLEMLTGEARARMALDAEKAKQDAKRSDQDHEFRMAQLGVTSRLDSARLMQDRAATERDDERDDALAEAKIEDGRLAGAVKAMDANTRMIAAKNRSSPVENRHS